jgi:hypothetical protein
MSERFFEADSFPDRRCWRAWRAHLAEVDAWELAENKSTVLRLAWWRRWQHELKFKLIAAMKRLEMGDASLLAEVLIEALEIAEAEKI